MSDETQVVAPAEVDEANVEREDFLAWLVDLGVNRRAAELALSNHDAQVRLTTLRDAQTAVRDRFDAADPDNFPRTGLAPWNVGYRSGLVQAMEDIRDMELNDD